MHKARHEPSMPVSQVQGMGDAKPLRSFLFWSWFEHSLVNLEFETSLRSRLAFIRFILRGLEIFSISFGHSSYDGWEASSVTQGDPKKERGVKSSIAIC